jgi:hypothetical protein
LTANLSNGHGLKGLGFGEATRQRSLAAALERTPPQTRHSIASIQEGVQPDAAERDPRMQNCSSQFDAVVTMLDTGTEAHQRHCQRVDIGAKCNMYENRTRAGATESIPFAFKVTSAG